jgi:hypothetical protein
MIINILNIKYKIKSMSSLNGGSPKNDSLLRVESNANIRSSFSP